MNFRRIACGAVVVAILAALFAAAPASATETLKAGGGPAKPLDVNEITAANRELLTLHELIAHRLVQILLGQHKGRHYSV